MQQYDPLALIPIQHQYSWGLFFHKQNTNRDLVIFLSKLSILFSKDLINQLLFSWLLADPFLVVLNVAI